MDGRSGPGGEGAVGHAHKVFNFVVERVQTQHQEMAVECVLGQTVKQDYVTMDPAQ